MAVTSAATGTKATQVGVAWTVTSATPAVFTLAGHGFVAGDIIRLATSNTIPTGLAVATDYYVIATGLATDTFEVSLTEGGTAVNTSSTGVGTQTIASLDALLFDTSAAASYLFKFAKNAYAAGDIFEARILDMIVTGGTKYVTYYSGQMGDAQPTDDLGMVSVPASTDLTDAGALRFRLKQSRGGNRAVIWKVVKIA